MAIQNLQKKRNIIDSESKGNYSHENPIKFLTKSIESSLCYYSDAYILVTRSITSIPNNAVTQVIFRNCAPFKDCITEISDMFVDYADFINITMPMYNLVEYSDNFSDASGSLCDFKRDEIIKNTDVTNDNNAPSFKYKANLIANAENNGTKNEVKLNNCKVQLSLKWIENCMITTGTTATFKITDAKLYVPIVTLSSEDNVKLSKLLSEGFKRRIYWNEYKVIPNKIVEIATNNDEKYIRNYLIQVGKELKDYLFFHITMQQVMVKFLLILIKNIFFQELK